MANQYSKDNQAIKIPSPLGRVANHYSLAGDSREPMVNQYSSEDSKAIKMEYYSEDNHQEAIKTPGKRPSAVSLAGDSREPMGGG